MYLLKYINSTNPTAPISGCVVLTEEEKTLFEMKMMEIMPFITPTTKFIVSVGMGFIQHTFEENLHMCHTMTEISEEEATFMQGIGDTGFARHFYNGVVNYTQDSFMTIQVEELTM